MRYTGTLTRWDDERGFGFIAVDQTGDQLFLHIKAFTGIRRRPVTGDRLHFEISRPLAGQSRAKAVLYEGEVAPLRHPPRSGGTRFGALLGTLVDLLIVATFGLLLTLLFQRQLIPPHLVALYLTASLLTFGLYWRDKQAARHGLWRTPETTLWLAGMLGGWPGAVLAQHRLRHKTRKRPFQAAFWLTVAANLGALGWLLTPNGAQQLARGISMLEQLLERLMPYATALLS
ncbi:DUF1294 domain-containing protein [Aestuariirhabdus litorea]|uniref:DUF1294 domain-containing protein n=1 Tax=Aestuariirhabdus litorea TaxID=2528527 RepID=A0A3P3VLX3_9GAMM|nr:DUF1294 domain-containing protein [Aestuariirhabdus litorea]RRJ83771.1 DUF1294 domain-containing protein [Aestuariirhabdus litorea]RWW96994.1 DUF1294 domain-containing protein [Endozoicomonadaceae bacterium GTF-13]